MAKQKSESQKLTGLIVQGMEDKKAKNITILDLHEIENAVADYFVVCHGSSKPQLEAIADGVIEKTLKKLKVKPWHKEGFENAEWILLDYVDVVVHIFREDRREFYQLEKLWADARITYHEYKE